MTFKLSDDHLRLLFNLQHQDLKSCDASNIFLEKEDVTSIDNTKNSCTFGGSVSIISSIFSKPCKENCDNGDFSDAAVMLSESPNKETCLPSPCPSNDSGIDISDSFYSDIMEIENSKTDLYKPRSSYTNHIVPSSPDLDLPNAHSLRRKCFTNVVSHIQSKKFPKFTIKSPQRLAINKMSDLSFKSKSIKLVQKNCYPVEINLKYRQITLKNDISKSSSNRKENSDEINSKRSNENTSAEVIVIDDGNDEYDNDLTNVLGIETKNSLNRKVENFYEVDFKIISSSPLLMQSILPLFAQP